MCAYVYHVKWNIINVAYIAILYRNGLCNISYVNVCTLKRNARTATYKYYEYDTAKYLK